ncbi:hypothetical protein NOR_08402 [Metarhizium rileyi]|uniref:Uncharacterized protein n=1 Tax=Metarhizium rileyi (strain RCEF 4871) TaxID=1649241 RepID=A0A166WB15_METRR|nr:hypothetical protein NOR_08402 [Metarhizium rileyi RCEF 4871]
MAAPSSQKQEQTSPAKLRYCVNLVVTPELMKELNQQYTLCCSWGFTSNACREPTYNVVGWSSEIFPNNPIHWNEKFRISATNHGCVPGYSVTNTLPIKRGETFVFQSFEDLDVVRSQADKSKTAISFQAKVGGCSIILSQGIDLYRAEEDSDFTHMFIASNGTLPFPFPTDDSIETTRTMLIFFTPKSNLLIRGMAFDRSSVAMEPLVFNYGKAESHFTEVTLDFVDGRPQILTPIKVFEDESC